MPHLITSNLHHVVIVQTSDLHDDIEILNGSLHSSIGTLFQIQNPGLDIGRNGRRVGRRPVKNDQLYLSIIIGSEKVSVYVG